MLAGEFGKSEKHFFPCFPEFDNISIFAQCVYVHVLEFSLLVQRSCFFAGAGTEGN